MDSNIKGIAEEILGTMVITTDEYKELVKRSAMLDIILSNKVESTYPSAVERQIILFRTILGMDTDKKLEETPDAE